MSRPTKSNVYKADTAELAAMADPLRDTASKMLDSAGRVHETIYGLDWQGVSKRAAEGRADSELVQDRAVGTAQNALADAYTRGATTMQPMIDALTSKAKGLEGESFAVAEDWTVTDTYDYASAKKLAPLFGVSPSFLDELQTRRANEAATETANLQRLADELGNADDDTATAIKDAKADLTEAVAHDAGSPPGVPPARVHNQRVAFRKVYGRDPVSDNDWLMAAALDPHTYRVKNHGVEAEIVAGRITPQPGKGVVRTNLFIPADQVFNLFKDGKDVVDGRLAPYNFGDNRGPSATADVEDSRVSLFVDYDNGLVVVRQNPTATVDGRRGGAAVSTPNVHVVEGSDGRLTIDYDAADAYEMDPAKWAGATVNGRVTFSPNDDGTVGMVGNTTVYPSMETYQYREGMPAAQLQWDSANSGSQWGPATSLTRHHWVGDTSISALRPDMPGWKWELENAIPFNDPFTDHATHLTNPFDGDLPTVTAGR